MRARETKSARSNARIRGAPPAAARHPTAFALTPDRLVPGFADEALTFAVGINNVLDEEPPVCFPCGVVGMSLVARDLPGRVGYLRVSYQQ